MLHFLQMHFIFVAAMFSPYLVANVEVSGLRGFSRRSARLPGYASWIN